MRKKIIFFISVICVSILIINLSKKNENMGKIVFEEKKYENNWALENEGNCTRFDREAWGSDEKKCEKGVDINLPKTGSYKLHRESIVAVIDTTVNIKSKGIYCNIWGNRKEKKNGIDDDGNGYVDDINGWNFCNNNNMINCTQNNDVGHGTEICNMISTVFPAEHLKLMILKVLHGNDAKGKISDVIKAIEYAEQQGAQICNLSIGTTVDYSLLKETIKKSNMLFIVSSGNGFENLNNKKNNVFPASYNLKNIISVADIRCDGELSFSSNYGNNVVDVAAPGTDIYVCDQKNEYQFVSGTSIATAFVTGEAALLYAISAEKKDAISLKENILENVTIRKNLKDKIATGGVINVQKAVDNVKK